MGVRISQLLWQFVTDFRKQLPDNEVVKQLYNMHITTDKINYVNIEKVGEEILLSYLPAKRIKQGTLDAEQFFTTGRQSGRIGATLKKMLSFEVPDQDLRKFTEALAAQFLQDTYDISVVSGEEMLQYFSQESYIVKEESELWKSCMRHDECKDYFGIYKDNENLSMVIATKDGKLAARALIWDNLQVITDYKPNPDYVVTEKDAKAADLGKERVKMLDRIYAIDPKAKNILWRWGLDNVDILHSIPKNATTFYVASTASVQKHVYLKQPIANYKYYWYPWIDTMGYLSVSEMALTNYLPLDEAGRKMSSLLFHHNKGLFERQTMDAPHVETIRAELSGNKPKKAAVKAPATHAEYIRHYRNLGYGPANAVMMANQAIDRQANRQAAHERAAVDALNAAAREVAAEQAANRVPNIALEL